MKKSKRKLRQKLQRIAMDPKKQILKVGKAMVLDQVNFSLRRRKMRQQ